MGRHAVVLLRGVSRDARHWQQWPVSLTQAWGQAVYCPDIPGNGRLWQQASPCQLAELVTALRAQLPNAAQPPWHIVGLSLGGLAGLGWAQALPHEVASLTLINSSLAGLNPWYQRLRPGALLRLPWALLLGAIAREPMLLAMTVQDPNLRAAYLPQWQRWAKAMGTRRSNLLRQLYCAARAAPARPACPTLVLASRQDRLVHCACSARLAAYWQLPIRWHEQAGHDLPLDAPDWLTAQLLAWWQRSEASAAP